MIQSGSADAQFENKSNAEQFIIIRIWMGYSNRAGFGAIGEAMGGLRYVSGDPSTPPSRIGISIGDQLAAMHACMGALMAIHARERTGIVPLSGF